MTERVDDTRSTIDPDVTDRAETDNTTGPEPDDVFYAAVEASVLRAVVDVFRDTDRVVVFVDPEEGVKFGGYPYGTCSVARAEIPPSSFRRFEGSDERTGASKAALANALNAVDGIVELRLTETGSFRLASDTESYDLTAREPNDPSGASLDSIDGAFDGMALLTPLTATVETARLQTLTAFETAHEKALLYMDAANGTVRVTLTDHPDGAAEERVEIPEEDLVESPRDEFDTGDSDPVSVYAQSLKRATESMTGSVEISYLSALGALFEYQRMDGAVNVSVMMGCQEDD